MTSSLDRSDPQIIKLVHWFTANGGWLNPDVKIVQDESHGFHVRAAKKLISPLTVATCPRSLTLSWLNLDHEQSIVPHVSSPLQKCLGTLPNHLLTYLLLVEQLVLEDESRWAPYISCLPDQDELTTPIWFSSDDSRYLESTPLFLAAQERHQEWHKEWAQARSAMANAGLEGSDVYDECDFNTFKWAATMMSSRSFTSQNILPEMDAFPILFPVIDIANHSGNVRARWEYPEDKSFSLRLLEDVEEGAEVFNNYGPKQNGELLLGYGFAVPNNPLEQVAIKIGLPSDALSSITKEDVPFRTDTDFLDDDDPASKSYYLRTPGHIFGRYESLIPFFRGFPPYVVFASYMMALRARNIDVHGISQDKVSGRLVLGTLLFLYRAMQVKCAKLPYPYTEVTSFPNAKQKYAYIYRDGQAKVCHAMRRELRVVLEKIQAIDSDTTVKDPSIFTFSHALSELKSVTHPEHDFPNAYGDFKKGMQLLFNFDVENKTELAKNRVEEKLWVLLLIAFHIIALGRPPSRSSTIIQDWMQDLYTTHPVSQTAIYMQEEVRIQGRGYEDYASYLTQLCTLQNSIWTQITDSQKDVICAWAIFVVHCETFVLPDPENWNVKKYYMYLRPVDREEKWMFEEVEVPDQEPEDRPDHAIWQGKFQ